MLVLDPVALGVLACEVGIAFLAAWRVKSTKSAIAKIEPGTPRLDGASIKYVLSPPLGETSLPIVIPAFIAVVFIGITLLGRTPFEIDSTLIGDPQYVIGGIGIFILTIPIPLLGAFRLTGEFITVSDEKIEVHGVKEVKRSLSWHSVKSLAKTPEIGESRVVWLTEDGTSIGIKVEMKGVERFYELALENLPSELRDSSTYKWMLRVMTREENRSSG